MLSEWIFANHIIFTLSSNSRFSFVMSDDERWWAHLKSFVWFLLCFPKKKSRQINSVAETPNIPSHLIRRVKANVVVESFFFMPARCLFLFGLKTKNHFFFFKYIEFAGRLTKTSLFKLRTPHVKQRTAKEREASNEWMERQKERLSAVLYTRSMVSMRKA